MLLSGGSGKRLWPMSNDIRSKQFLPVLDDGSGNKESMLQRVFRQLRLEFPSERAVIATGAAQKEQIEAQLGEHVDIVCEPARRDTFAAIGLSCTYLADLCDACADDVVIVLPVDVYADQQYFTVLRHMAKMVEQDKAELVLMGIVPTHPSNRFGYMVPADTATGYAQITRFVEKPSEDVARSLIDNGALWNGGVFAFRLGYLMDIITSRMTKMSFTQFLATYPTVEKISFDYAVVEKAKSVAMVPYHGMWRDLGTWPALLEEIGPQGIGNHIVSGTEQTIVINELPIPVVATGTKNIIIAASADGILVSDISASSQIKPVVDVLHDPPRFMQHPWGTASVIDRITTGDTITAETRSIDILKGKEWVIDTSHNVEISLICLQGSGSIKQRESASPLPIGQPLSIDCSSAVTIIAESGLHLIAVIRYLSHL